MSREEKISELTHIMVTAYEDIKDEFGWAELREYVNAVARSSPIKTDNQFIRTLRFLRRNRILYYSIREGIQGKTIRVFHPIKYGDID